MDGDGVNGVDEVENRFPYPTYLRKVLFRYKLNSETKFSGTPTGVTLPCLSF